MTKVRPSAASEQFGKGEGGVMLRWDSADGQSKRYYALEGNGCCFCPTGSDLIAWQAPSPLGPWTPVRGGASINPAYTGPDPPIKPDCHGCQVGSCCVKRAWALPTQQQGVTPMMHKLTQSPAGCEGGYMMWSGDAWQQAPDDLKASQ